MTRKLEVGDVVDITIKGVRIADTMPRVPRFGTGLWVSIPTADGSGETRALIRPDSPTVTVEVVEPATSPAWGPVSTDPGTPALAPADETGHVDAKCTNPECYGCMFCNGGLWGCAVCGGLEGGMPSNCPGESMTAEQSDAVYAGDLDFRDGQWVEGVASRFCPKGLWGEAK